ncbi:hypothetical protein [Plebeiibacterium sediminum]|uniref:GDYXXLXY domain-containing protein n=1 Tax=Plebeiibacterium sediminum TaxID=2992112 RepID=A0AAE3M7E6_9BACT|nr:hypothetical protein [Plebeiobacterium sediminum]MCW3788666.1 hypothetical protein [Plebeiobacterium sediminum]
MKYAYFIAILGLFVSFNITALIKDGYYIGLKTIEKIHKHEGLVYKNHLLIKGDSAYLYKEPIRIYNNDTSRLVSDCSFYYKGYFKNHEKGNSKFLELELIDCDYCAREILVDSITGKNIFKPDFKNYKVKPGKELIIDDVKYKYQTSKIYPVDIVVFYRSHEVEIEETPEINFLESIQ